MTISHGETLPTAAVLVIGTELVEGLRVDTNGPEVARALASAGFAPRTIVALSDDRSLVSARIKDAMTFHDIVVVTGGLGPTHDDITREAAADALGLDLVCDTDLAERLADVVHGHAEPGAASQVMRQAMVIEGARILRPVTGTAPGQVVGTPNGELVLLPGPPGEMRPMLAEMLEPYRHTSAVEPVTVGCVGVRESDAQLRAQRALADHPGITLTVLGRPSLVDVVLIPAGADADAMAVASAEVAHALEPYSYSSDGSTLADIVIREAATRCVTLALAESCTGGLVAGALTDGPGSSDAFLGGVVAYSNQAKHTLLDVDEGLLEFHGAVSAECASAMATGARIRFGADIAVAITGIAGPGGATPDKPVGLVWFACDQAGDVVTTSRHFAGDRALVRARATVFALDLVRRRLIATP